MPCSPVNDVDQVFEDPQVQQREMQISMPHPLSASGTVDLIGNPIKFSETPVDYRLPPPYCGQHTPTMCWRSCCGCRQRRSAACGKRRDRRRSAGGRRAVIHEEGSWCCPAIPTMSAHGSPRGCQRPPRSSQAGERIVRDPPVSDFDDARDILQESSRFEFMIRSSADAKAACTRRTTAACDAAHGTLLRTFIQPPRGLCPI